MTDIQAFAELELVRLEGLPGGISFELGEEYHPCLKQFLDKELNDYLTYKNYSSDRLAEIYKVVFGEAIKLKHLFKNKPFMKIEEDIFNEPKIEELTPEPVFKPSLWDLNFDFSNITNHPIRLDAGTVIEDPKSFIESHLEICNAHNGKRAYYPYYQRLKKVSEYIKTKL